MRSVAQCACILIRTQTALYFHAVFDHIRLAYVIPICTLFIALFMLIVMFFRTLTTNVSASVYANAYGYQWGTVSLGLPVYYNIKIDYSFYLIIHYILSHGFFPKSTLSSLLLSTVCHKLRLTSCFQNTDKLHFYDLAPNPRR